MWSVDEIEIEITLAEHPVMGVEITTPRGCIQILGDISRVGRVLRIDGAHVQGLHAGALGRSGLNAIGQKLLVVVDVDEIVIAGSTRTTGRNKGRIPREIRFPRSPDPAVAGRG